MRQLKAFENGDGSHCGLSDWYDDKKHALKCAIRSKSDWTTGWYSSKKEIACANIRRFEGTYIIEVNVSDDFDTQGTAHNEFKTKSISVDFILDKIADLIDKTWEQADDDRQSNQVYRGFSIIKNGRCVETYILNATGELDYPPGDNYSEWGFQGEAVIPNDVKKKLEEWAKKSSIVSLLIEPGFSYKGYTIRPWCS